MEIPNLSGSKESLGINPITAHQWILNWVVKTRIDSQLFPSNSRTQTEPINKPAQVENDELQFENLASLAIPNLVAHSARKDGIPEALFYKLIETESGFNPSAKSFKGAMGLGQLMSATAEELGLNLSPEGG